MPELGPWLKQRASMRRELGVHDCCAFPADWAVACGWPDPMAAWRGTYSATEEAEQLIADAGGLLALFERSCAEVGIARRTGEPQLGDVGVLMIERFAAGAIYVGPRWALVAERGIGLGSVEPENVVAVWAIS